MLSRVAVRHSSYTAFYTPKSIRAASFRQLPKLGQRAGRQYATKPIEAAKKTSDLPWAAVATVITIPSVYLILQRSPEPHDGHGREQHKEEHEEEDKSTVAVKSDDKEKEEVSEEEKEPIKDEKDQDEKSPGGEDAAGSETSEVDKSGGDESDEPTKQTEEEKAP